MNWAGTFEQRKGSDKGTRQRYVDRFLGIHRSRVVLTRELRESAHSEQFIESYLLAYFRRTPSNQQKRPAGQNNKRVYYKVI